MVLKVFGELKIPAIGLGTWGMGGKYEKDSSQEIESINAIKFALDLGITHIDTAELYGNGFTEELIGRAIESYNRRKIFLTSKVWSAHLTYEGVIQAFNNTIKRLKTDYLDLYLIHRPSDDMDFKGTMKAMEHLNETGMAKAIGISNFSLEQIKEAERFLVKSRISALQYEYNLIERCEGIYNYCKENGIAFIAYRPLMRGYLAGREIPLVSELSKKYNKSPAQIALNWLISKEQIVAIPKAIRKEHIEEIAGSEGWAMSQDDYKLLGNINYKNLEVA